MEHAKYGSKNFRKLILYHDISRTTRDINFKLDDSMYHHRKMIYHEIDATFKRQWNIKARWEFASYSGFS